MAACEKSVFGCLLIGGKSRRMGSPKHLLTLDDGSTWLEHGIAVLEQVVECVVISGAGEVPASVRNIRIDDAHGVSGPLAGILAVMRWRDDVSWLIAACDMPHISMSAASWLLAQRKGGAVAVMARLAEHNPVEPLFAWYDGSTLPFWEKMAEQGELRISRFVDFCPDVQKAMVPEYLRDSWKNINSAGELER